MTIFEDIGGCAGCLYESYRVEKFRASLTDAEAEVIEPRIWCTQVLGFVCSDANCLTNIYEDPFNCAIGDDDRGTIYPMQELEKFVIDAD